MRYCRKSYLLLIGLGSILLSHCRGKDDFLLFHPPPSSLTDHMVLEASISDDGRTAAKITSDGRFALVDVASRHVVWQRQEPAGSIHAVAVDPTGRFLAYPRDCRHLIVEDTRGAVVATYDLPGRCLDVHALAMAADGYPIMMGACGRGIYSISSRESQVTSIRESVHCESELDGVQSLSVDWRARWIIAAWMYGADRINHGFAVASERSHAGWWRETGAGDGVGVTVFDSASRSIIAELEGSTQASSAGISPDGGLMVVGYAGDIVRLRSMKDGEVRWSTIISAGNAVDFICRSRFVVAERSSPLEGDSLRLYVLDTSDGRMLSGAPIAKEDIMTRGNFSARNGDKFLVAHRTGIVDVYQVSPDGREIKKYWSF